MWRISIGQLIPIWQPRARKLELAGLLLGLVSWGTSELLVAGYEARLRAHQTAQWAVLAAASLSEIRSMLAAREPSAPAPTSGALDASWAPQAWQADSSQALEAERFLLVRNQDDSQTRYLLDQVIQLGIQASALPSTSDLQLRAQAAFDATFGLQFARESLRVQVEALADSFHLPPDYFLGLERRPIHWDTVQLILPALRVLGTTQRRIAATREALATELWALGLEVRDSASADQLRVGHRSEMAGLVAVCLYVLSGLLAAAGLALDLWRPGPAVPAPHLDG